MSQALTTAETTRHHHGRSVCSRGRRGDAAICTSRGGAAREQKKTPSIPETEVRMGPGPLTCVCALLRGRSCAHVLVRALLVHAAAVRTVCVHCACLRARSCASCAHAARAHGASAHWCVHYPCALLCALLTCALCVRGAAWAFLCVLARALLVRTVLVHWECACVRLRMHCAVRTRCVYTLSVRVPCARTVRTRCQCLRLAACACTVCVRCLRDHTLAA